MDDLSRIFGEGKCSCNDCISDPDPATDYDMPGDLRFGSRAWLKAMDSRADDRLDFTLSDPEDDDEFLSEYDLIEGDAPFAEDVAWWENESRNHPAACEIMLAEAQVRQDYEQYNGFLDVLDEASPSETERWFRRDVTEF